MNSHRSEASLSVRIREPRHHLHCLLASVSFIFVTERFSSEPDQESLSCTPLGPGSKVVPRSIGFRRARLGTPWLLRQMPGTGRQMTSVAGRLSGASRMKKRLSSVSKLRVVAELPSTSRKRRVDIEEPEPELRALDEDQLAKVVSSVVERTVASLVQGGGKRRRLSEPEERIAMQAAIAAATATAAVLNPLIGRGQNGSSGPETSRLSSKGPKLRNPGRAEQLLNATRATRRTTNLSARAKSPHCSSRRAPL